MRRLDLSPSALATGPLPRVLGVVALIVYLCASGDSKPEPAPRATRDAIDGAQVQ